MKARSFPKKVIKGSARFIRVGPGRRRTRHVEENEIIAEI
jgi:hypothetical protein